MTLLSKIARPAIAAAALTALGACATPPEPEGARTALAPGDCFSTTQWRGWSSPADDVLYLRVRHHDIYKVDLLPGSGRIDRGGRFIISEVRGSSRICSANDLRLWTSDTHGFRSPVFPRAISMLTAEEIEALPRSDRP